MVEPRQVLYSPVDIQDADFTEFEPDAKMLEENAEFEQFKTEMHDAQFDAKITVGKKLTDSSGRPMGRQIFECFECGIDDYTFSQLCTRIREDFGTGLYQVQGRDSKGKYKFKKTVGILAPNTPDNAPAGQDVGTLIEKFSFLMERQQERMEGMIGRRDKGFFDGMTPEKTVALVTAIGGMFTALGFKPFDRPEKKSVIEELTEYKLTHELIGDLKNNDSEDNGLYGMLGKVAENFGPALMSAMAAAKQTGEVDETGIIRGKQPAQLEAPVMSEQEKLIEQHRANVTFLLTQAKGGAEAADVAQFVITNVPDENLEEFEAFLGRPDCIEIFKQAVPEVANHEKWFVELQTFLLSEIAQIFDPPADEIREDQSGLTGEPVPAQTPASDVAGGESGANESDELNGGAKGDT